VGHRRGAADLGGRPAHQGSIVRVALAVADYTVVIQLSVESLATGRTCGHRRKLETVFQSASLMPVIACDCL
jgi:hypothetical protein